MTMPGYTNRECVICRTWTLHQILIRRRQWRCCNCDLITTKGTVITTKGRPAMPVLNGRLVCCMCGADLGDAADPYRDPACPVCLDEENDADIRHEQELERQAMEAELADD